MSNKGWMTAQVIRRRLEDSVSNRHATFIDERDWRKLVREVQYIVKYGYSRGFTAGKIKASEQDK